MNTATRRLVQRMAPKNNKSGVNAAEAIFNRSCSTPNLQQMMFMQVSVEVSFVAPIDPPLRKRASTYADLSRALLECSIDNAVRQPAPEEPVAAVQSTSLDDGYWDMPSDSTFNDMTVARKEARDRALQRVQERVLEKQLMEEAERQAKACLMQHAAVDMECDSDEYWFWDTPATESEPVTPHSMPLHQQTSVHQQTSDASPEYIMSTDHVVHNYWDHHSDSFYSDTVVAHKDARDLAIRRVQESVSRRREDYWAWDVPPPQTQLCAQC